MTIEEGDAFHALLVMNLHCQFARKSDAPAETLRLSYPMEYDRFFLACAYENVFSSLGCVHLAQII